MTAADRPHVLLLTICGLCQEPQDIIVYEPHEAFDCPSCGFEFSIPPDAVDFLRESLAPPRPRPWWRFW